MPLPMLKSLVAKANKHNKKQITLKHAETLWDQAKEQSAKQYGTNSDSFYPVAVHVLKKMLHIPTNHETTAAIRMQYYLSANSSGQPKKLFPELLSDAIVQELSKAPKSAKDLALKIMSDPSTDVGKALSEKAAVEAIPGIIRIVFTRLSNMRNVKLIKPVDVNKPVDTLSKWTLDAAGVEKAGTKKG